MTVDVITSNIDGIELPEPVHLRIGSDDGMVIYVRRMNGNVPKPESCCYVNDDNWIDVGPAIMEEVFDHDV